MARKRPIVRIVNATEAKNRFGEMIQRAYLQDEHLIVKRGGIPVVAIVPMADYERLITAGDLPADIAEEVGISAQAALARKHLVEFLDQAHEKTPEVPEAEAEQDIKEAIRAVRAGK